MKKVIILSLLLTVTLATTLHAEKRRILLSQVDVCLEADTLVSPAVTLEDRMLTIAFPSPTPSQVSVTDAETGSRDIMADYDTAHQVLTNVACLPNGRYCLRVSAHGKWWEGTFIMNDK